MNDVRTRIRRGVAGVLAALALTAGAFTLTGCAEATAADSVAGPEPVVKEEIGDTEISTLTLTPEAVDRLGLMTVEVEDGRWRTDRSLRGPDLRSQRRHVGVYEP